MAHLDVHRNTFGRSRKIKPFVIDVQSDILRHHARRCVIPLVLRSALERISARLNPVFAIEGQEVVLLPTEISSIPPALLTEPVCSLQHRRADIVAALDLLFTGV